MKCPVCNSEIKQEIKLSKFDVYKIFKFKKSQGYLSKQIISELKNMFHCSTRTIYYWLKKYAK